MGWIVSPYKDRVKSQAIVPLNMTLLGNWVFTEEFKLKWGH